METNEIQSTEISYIPHHNTITESTQHFTSKFSFYYLNL